MRHIKLKAKIIWLLITDQYTYDARNKKLLLWSDEKYSIQSETQHQLDTKNDA